MNVKGGLVMGGEWREGEKERERERAPVHVFTVSSANSWVSADWCQVMPVKTSYRFRNPDNGLLTNAHSSGRTVVKLTAQLLVS